MKESLRHIKHQFMAYRNGIVADTLRKAHMPYNIIYGLQLPQISTIAKELPSSMELAMLLWEDKTVRESRLLACYLFPTEHLTEKQCIDLASTLQTREEADIICFRLFRRLSFANHLVEILLQNESPLVTYCGEALVRNLEVIK